MLIASSQQMLRRRGRNEVSKPIFTRDVEKKEAVKIEKDLKGIVSRAQVQDEAMVFI